MKLTNTMRDAFVRAAMNDVPQIDYNEQIRSAVLADIVAKMPKKVRDVWNDASLQGWLNKDWSHFFGVTVTIPCQGVATNEVSAETRAICECLAQQNKEQAANRKNLRDKLQAAAYSVTTREKLAELLPEFEKYLPASPTAASRSVPVVTGLIDDFKAAGWPKGK